jgi:hypothetical protein
MLVGYDVGYDVDEEIRADPKEADFNPASPRFESAENEKG